MSDVGLGATLQLEIADALRRIDDLGVALTAATTGIQVGLDPPDATPVTTAIDTAVQASDTTVTPDAEAGAVTTGIDEAVAAADTTVPVDADTTVAAADIAGLADTTSVTVPVDADTAPAEGAISDLAATDVSIDIPVNIDDAGLAAAEAAVAGLGDTVTGVADNIDNLGSSVEGLGSKSSSATPRVGGLTSVSSTLNVASGLAQGNVGGLGEKIAALSPAAGAAVGGVAALATTTKLLFDSGLKAVEAEERLTRTFGPLTAAVQTIHVGDLTGDLDKLAASLGTSNIDLEDAATKIGQLGQSSGASNPKIVETVDNILALSLRVRALNPELGQSGDIAERVFTALGKGGRGLATFNIAVDQAAVKQEALRQNTGKSADELTKFDIQAAASTVLIQKYGASLAEVIAGGGNDPTIRLARLREGFTELRQELGKELVVPVIDLLEALQPLGLSVVEVLGAIVNGLGPLFTLIGQLAGPFSAISDGLASVNPGLLQMAVGIGLVGTAITVSLPELTTISLVLVGIATAVGGLIHALDSHSGPSKEFTQGVKAANAALADGSKTVQQSTGELVANGIAAKTLPPVLSQLGVSYRDIARAVTAGGAALNDLTTKARLAGLAQLLAGKDGAKFAEQIERGGGSVSGLTSAAEKGREPLAKYLESVGVIGVVARKLAEQIDGATKSTAALREENNIAAESQLTIAVGNKEITQSYLDAGKATGNYVQALEDGRQAAQDQAQATINLEVRTGQLSRTQVDAAVATNTATDGAINWVAALQAIQEAQTNVAIAAEQFNTALINIGVTAPTIAVAYAEINAGTGTVSSGLTNLAVALARANVGQGEFQTVADGLGISVESLHKLVDGITGAIDAYASEVASKLPGIGDAFTGAGEAAKAAKRDLTLDDIVKSFQKSIAAITDEQHNLEFLVSKGLIKAAGLAAQFGPQYVQALTEGVKGGDLKVAQSLESSLIPGLIGAQQGFTTFVRDQFGPEIVHQTGGVAAQIGTTLGGGFDLTNILPTTLKATGLLIPANGPLLTVPAGQLGTATAGAFTDTLATGLPATVVASLRAAGVIIPANTDLLTRPTGQLGVATVGALTEIINPGLPKATRDALVASGVIIQTQTPVIAGFATLLGQQVNLGVGGALIPGLPQVIQSGLDQGRAAISGQQGVFADAGTNLGLIAASHVGTGISTNASAIPPAIRGLVGDSNMPFAFADAQGQHLGGTFASGVSVGIQAGSHQAATAAQQLVDNAHRAAVQQAKASSPSKLFATLGVDLARGLAVGLTGGGTDVVAAAEQIVNLAAKRTQDAITAATAAGGNQLLDNLLPNGLVGLLDRLQGGADVTGGDVAAANRAGEENLAHALEALLKVQSDSAAAQQSLADALDREQTDRDLLNAKMAQWVQDLQNGVNRDGVTKLSRADLEQERAIAASRFTGQGFSPAAVQAAAVTQVGDVRVQVDMGGFTFTPDTTPAQVDAFVRSATKSAVDTIRDERAVFTALQMAGRG